MQNSFDFARRNAPDNHMALVTNNSCAFANDKHMEVSAAARRASLLLRTVRSARLRSSHNKPTIQVPLVTARTEFGIGFSMCGSPVTRQYQYRYI
jgi:hypothetical protein